MQPPQKPNPWNEVKDVLDYGNDCVRVIRSNINNGITGSEDCLYLNIFVPSE